MIKEEESSSMKLPMMVNKIILELVVSLLALDPSIHPETSSSYSPSAEEESSKYLPRSLHLHTIVFHGQFETINVEIEVEIFLGKWPNALPMEEVSASMADDGALTASGRRGRGRQCC